MRTDDSSQMGGEKETGRLEAFSDAVFAIAITLLVLGIKVPPHMEGVSSWGLLTLLFKQWPSYLAFFLSFISILVIWVKHHNVFTHIKHVDNHFLYLNGLLLLFVTLLPFPTALLAAYIQHEPKVAAVVYSGNYLCIALAFNLLWRYASSDGYRLLGKDMDQGLVVIINRRCNYGLLYTLGSVFFAFVNENLFLAYLLIFLPFNMYPLALWRTNSNSGKNRTHAKPPKSPIA
jgi:uncharacterized membrane protein